MGVVLPPLAEAVGMEVAGRKCEQTDPVERCICLVQRAEQRLRSGRVEEAEGDIHTQLNLGPEMRTLYWPSSRW